MARSAMLAGSMPPAYSATPNILRRLVVLLLLTVVGISSPAAAASHHPAPAAPGRAAARWAAPLAPVAAAILRRDYQDSVCKPATRQVGDTVPPCVEIETIETMCTPNGTGPLFLAAHQQCMCRGSYFADWPACLSCLFLHGQRTERDVGQYMGVLAAASSSFCDAAAAPTAEFASVFAAVQATAAPPATGATVASDRAPGQTAVSLYYTATARQGPGRITGDAALATATALLTATRAPTSAQDAADDSPLGTKSAKGSGTVGVGGKGGPASTTATPAASGPSSSTESNAALFGRAMDWCFLVGTAGAIVALVL
ncbi:hypothetical protein QBC33DRAFT_231154 [Phialemonium atrogriseum]|uniref:Uncharacterized protein n=1 Tax=Phialemonium atrogriseum TaxID=1093897 RepID=A0AAJ0C6X0_9PEZI|nr:uncharacterized protein QBC33DRAFT_231154 [Phialemonium atrogriseum]KAK1771091.1 hypothetical protein QBC33DRAFT_231154 [Phialemonium atrogriseum]